MESSSKFNDNSHSEEEEEEDDNIEGQEHLLDDSDGVTTNSDTQNMSSPIETIESEYSNLLIQNTFRGIQWKVILRISESLCIMNKNYF